MTIKVLINDVYYDITSIVKYDVQINGDISKVLDLADFVIPICKADTISGLDLSTPFVPLTKIEITIFSSLGSEVKRYLVREDTMEVIYLGDPKVYSHKVSLIEPTKLLELRTVPDFSITQPQGTYSTATSELDIDPEEEDTSGFYQLTDNVFNVIPLTNTTSPSISTIIDENILKEAGRTYNILGTIDLYNDDASIIPQWEVLVKVNGVTQFSETVQGNDDIFEKVELLLSFQYTTSVINELLTVEIKPTAVTQTSNTSVETVSIIITSQVESGLETPVWYMDEVIDKALESNKIADINDTTFEYEFTLADNTRNRINNIVAPEDTYERRTIWEILEEQANLVKAIPRLSLNSWNEITFDFIEDLDDTTYTNIKKTDETQSLILDNFSTAIEINADNVIESIEDQAIKVEPYEDGWMTLRSETEGPNQLTDETVGLKVRTRIYKNKQIIARGFTVTYSDATSDGPTTEWDISNYVVEKEKWESLPNLAYDSSAERTVINQGKGNTIYYSKGSNRYVGFGYRAPKQISISESPDQVIYQIIASVATQETGKIVTDVNGSQSLTDLLNTQYRVYYSAFKKVRARLYKHNARDFEIDTTLYSNEQAKVNDNVNLGRYNQSLVNKSGKNNYLESGITKDYNQVPKVGQLINDNQVITKVDVTIKNGLYEYGIASYVDFAEISNFVGIKSEYRQYEIPNKDIVERILIYEEHISVGRGNQSKTHTTIEFDGFTILTNPFTLGTVNIPVTYHQMKTRENVLNPGDANWEVFDTESEGPVDILSLGTTTIINATVKDNYSVDDIVEEKELGVTPKYYQNNYRYTNNFGQYDSARYSMYIKGLANNTVADGNIYPEISSTTTGDKVIEIDIRVKKDSREAIYYTHQFNFFAQINNGLEDFRVYDGIAKYNGFAIGDLNANIVPVLLLDNYFPSVEETTIKPNKYVETTGTGLGGIPNGKISVFYEIDVLPTPTSILYTGWGLIERTSKELIFMVKQEIQSNDTTTVVYEETIDFTPDKTKGK